METLETADQLKVQETLELEYKKIKLASISFLLSGCVLVIFGMALLKSFTESLYIPLAILYIMTGALGVQSLKKNQEYLLKGLQVCTVLVIIAHIGLIFYFCYLLTSYILNPVDCLKFRGVCEFNTTMSIVLSGFSFIAIFFLSTFTVLLFFYLKTVKAYSKGLNQVKSNML